MKATTQRLLAIGGWALLALCAVALPYVVVSGPARLLTVMVAIYALTATSWNLTIGTAGIFNFAHMGFFGVGGYIMAIATLQWELDPWLALVMSTIGGGVAGALCYLPVIRLRSIYIALITFIFVQLCYHAVLALPSLTGGSNGLPGVPTLEIGDYNLGADAGVGYLWLTGALVFIVLLGSRLLQRTSFGMSVIALRDNENLATARGISRVRQHLVVFTISGAVAGLAGAIYASYFHVADVSLFSLAFVTLGLSMIFLGGIGYLFGPLIGAVVVTIIQHNLADAGAWRPIIFGVGVIVVLWIVPGGIAGLLVSARDLVRRLVSRENVVDLHDSESTRPHVRSGA